MADKKKAGFWGLTKQLAKEAQKIVGNTIEGVKSISENVKVKANKHHLEHIEKMKKLELKEDARGKILGPFNYIYLNNIVAHIADHFSKNTHKDKHLLRRYHYF